MYQIILYVCIIILLIINIYDLLKNRKSKNTTDDNTSLLNNIGSMFNSSAKTIGDSFASSQRDIGKLQSEKLESIERRFADLEKSNREALESMRKTLEERVSKMSEDNTRQLDTIRHTVDEKLQKTLNERMNESFKLVNERLQQVYEGLGEMKTLATGVGDLKKVLSNVKTRGILGEIQLGAILDEILSPEQYDVDVAVIPSSKNRVEYAIKLPADDGKFIYMPIDSKFPGDAYNALLDAYDSGNADTVKTCKADLVSRVKGFAKDISTKYIEAPYTTDFAIMFLPFEGLYAEVVNLGLIEELQRSYKVNICGPSTMAAYLNSLQMGFKTLALQKRSAEVWEVLGAVKTEFDKFAGILEKTQSKLNSANDELTKLIGTRTNVIRRKLRDVEQLDDVIAGRLLGTDSNLEDE